MNKLAIIAALADNYVIGNGPDIPWRDKELYAGGNLPDDLKEDMRRFKALTTGQGNNAIIMGRKTYFGRPLPNRRNIVVSRSMPQADGITVVRSIDEALEAAKGCDETWCIGGGEVYRAMLPLADRMELTWVKGLWQGDTHFPIFRVEDWRRIEYEKHGIVTFTTYERR